MADVFLKDDARSLINGKYVLYFGGSNMRALYKDLIVLLLSNRLMLDRELRKKLEPSFFGDSLLQAIGLTRGRDFKEHRKFTLEETIIEYFFITKCFCPDVWNTLNEILNGERRKPDVILMNSTLWDISRWGSESVELFKGNLRKLIAQLRCLPPTTLVIWLTVPPVSQNHRGVLIPEVEFLKHTMRFDAMEANVFAHRLMADNGFDVLDLHYYLKLSVHKRCEDGVHWKSPAVRYMTNLLLTHISLAWGKALPGREGRQETQLKKLLEDMDENINSMPVQNAEESVTLKSTIDENVAAQEKSSEVINETNQGEAESLKEGGIEEENDFNWDSRPHNLKGVYYGCRERVFRRGRRRMNLNNRNKDQSIFDNGWGMHPGTDSQHHSDNNCRMAQSDCNNRPFEFIPDEGYCSNHNVRQFESSGTSHDEGYVSYNSGMEQFDSSGYSWSGERHQLMNKKHRYNKRFHGYGKYNTSHFEFRHNGSGNYNCNYRGQCRTTPRRSYHLNSQKILFPAKCRRRRPIMY